MLINDTCVYILRINLDYVTHGVAKWKQATGRPVSQGTRSSWVRKNTCSWQWSRPSVTILYLSFKEIESQGEKKKEREKERIGKQEKREFSDDRENRMKKYEKNKKKKGRKGWEMDMWNWREQKRNVGMRLSTREEWNKKRQETLMWVKIGSDGFESLVNIRTFIFFWRSNKFDGFKSIDLKYIYLDYLSSL